MWIMATNIIKQKYVETKKKQHKCHVVSFCDSYMILILRLWYIALQWIGLVNYHLSLMDDIF